jgi:hypothetical protein
VITQPSGMHSHILVVRCPDFKLNFLDLKKIKIQFNI